MKVPASRADSFVRALPADISCVLVFGPDRGLVRERIETLVLGVVDDPGDPFRVTELTAADIKSDPPKFRDEVDALAMTGGRRVVVVRGAGDDLTEHFKSLLGAGGGGALVLAEAGELPARSSLRKLFEGHEGAAAIASYGDQPGVVERVIAESLQAEGLRADSEAMAYLVGHLGSDRQVTRSELLKLALYMGGDGGGPGRNIVTVEDAIAAVGDSAAISLDEVAYAAAGGERDRLDRELSRCFQEGLSPVAVLRAVARHLQRLHLALGLIEEGQPPDRVTKSMRPPVMFLFAGRFERQASSWRPDRLAGALEVLSEAEAGCKSTAMPAAAICGRALMRVSQAARR